MGKIIAPCGIICSSCPAFLATRNNDTIAREKIATQWSQDYETNIVSQDINCEGCLEEVHFKYGEDCPIRKCCLDKGFTSCSECPDYSCGKLENFFGFVQEAKLNLDKLRQKRI